MRPKTLRRLETLRHGTVRTPRHGPPGPRALLRRLWRAQLRLRVLAGVVVVTLVALVGFDIAAVQVMRGYLLGQTDQNLRGALTVTSTQLSALVPGYSGLVAADARTQAVASVGSVTSAPRSAVVRNGATGAVAQVAPQLRSILGEFDIVFLPAQGKQLTLEIGAVGPAGRKLELPADIAKVANGTGPWTVGTPGTVTQIRLAGATVVGGRLIAGTSLDTLDSTMGSFERIIAFGSLAVIALIGAGVFLVLRRGLRPIESMASQADRITAGDLTERVTTRSPRSELGRLGTALNGMLARIEAGVTERETAQEQTRRFFADASHELRTPLASLRANAELYLQGALTSQDQVDEVMDRIAVETRRMGRLVDDMLRLARLGQHPDQGRRPVDLTALLTSCATRVRIADPARGWHTEIEPGLRTVGDEELLRRAVDNLVGNVRTHTPDETAATLTATSDGETIAIEVSDNGPGVDPDQLPHLFERFYRAGVHQDRPGSGLGLAIAAEVAAAHGGTATATQIAPHGLRITLTLPAVDLAETDRGGPAFPPPLIALSWLIGSYSPMAAAVPAGGGPPRPDNA